MVYRSNIVIVFEYGGIKNGNSGNVCGSEGRSELHCSERRSGLRWEGKIVVEHFLLAAVHIILM